MNALRKSFSMLVPRGARSLATLRPTDQRLRGKVAVVTGGASGIGEATARLFVAHGARTVIADIQDELGTKLAGELQTEYSPAAARYVHCDVRVENDMAAAVDVAHSIEGHVDVMYSNAGILGALGPLDQTHMDELSMTLDVNLRGNFLGLKHAARVMKPLGCGSVIVTGSVAGVVGGLGPHAYSMCKAGLVGLVRSAAVELRDFGIRVNMISPDATPTKFLATALETVQNAPVSLEEAGSCVKDHSLLPNRPLSAMDIAYAALFLAGDEAGYMSGQNLVIDASNTVTKPAFSILLLFFCPISQHELYLTHMTPPSFNLALVNILAGCFHLHNLKKQKTNNGLNLFFAIIPDSGSLLRNEQESLLPPLSIYLFQKNVNE